MAWFRPSAIDQALWPEYRDAHPRYRVGVVAYAALRGRGDAAIREPVPAVRCHACDMVDGHDPRRDPRAGQRGPGDALARFRELVRVHNVGTRCICACPRALGCGGWYRGVADATGPRAYSAACI